MRAFIVCLLVPLSAVAQSEAQQTTSLQDLLESVRRERHDASYAARLRVTNSGEEDIEDLTVLFPNGEVGFGDVPVGTTTEYKEATGGVYRYAAFRLQIDGQLVTQPVIDWVGAAPMEGTSFTYELELVAPGRPWPSRLAVRLVEVIKDE